MEFSQITGKDYAGNLLLINANRYFSDLIKNRAYDFPRVAHWRIHIEDDIVYPLDEQGRMIREGGRSITDIVALADIINNILLGYANWRDSSINWPAIIHQAECRLKKNKTEEAENLHASFYGIPTEVVTPPDPDKKIHTVERPAFQSLTDCRNVSTNLWMNLWHERELCCLFADSNLGKSALAVQIGCEIAKSRKVLFCDYEMSDEIFFSRYRDNLGNIYPFPRNFFRSKPLPEVFFAAHPETLILKDLEKVIKEEDFKVVIIDNISFLGRDCYRPRNISALIYRLKILQQKYDLSILILAHTAKRKDNSQISQNDLLGSKRLFNFIDSCFAIGKAAKPAGCQYLKQLKSRSSHLEYGENNVILMERVFSNGWLHFEFKGYDTECACINIPTPKGSINLPEEVSRLAAEGKTQRQIAARLEISLSKVNRILNKSKIQP